MNEDTPTEGELAEAKALARALAGERDLEGAPRDALEVEALLRYAAGHDAISPDALQAVRDSVFGAGASAGNGDVRGRPRSAPRRLLPYAVGTLATAAALVLAWVGTSPRAPRASVSPAAPAPLTTHSALASVLDAQALVLGDPERDLSELERATRAHRAEVLAQLERRLGAEP